MPTVNRETQDKISAKPAQHLDAALGTVSLTVSPVFLCGVSRKVNTGNYENIDIYAGLSLPLSDGSLQEREVLREMVEAAAELGFSIVSEQTYARYELIKTAQKAMRK